MREEEEMKEKIDLDAFYRELEQIGIEGVREKIALGYFGHPLNPGDKAPLAKAWLAKKEAVDREGKRQEDRGLVKWAIGCAIAGIIVTIILAYT